MNLPLNTLCLKTSINECSFCKVFGHQISECGVLSETLCKYCKEKGHTTKHCTKLKLKNQLALQSKIIRYDAEFPEIYGSKSLPVSDVQKIENVDFIINREKLTAYNAYLERQNRHQARKEKQEKNAQIKEELHVQKMIQKWGTNWYINVHYTDDDCDTAKILRYEGQEEDYQRELMYDIRLENQKIYYEQQKKLESDYVSQKKLNILPKNNSECLHVSSVEQNNNDFGSIHHNIMDKIYGSKSVLKQKKTTMDFIMDELKRNVILSYLEGLTIAQTIQKCERKKTSTYQRTNTLL